jgi:hypothetical protein
LNFFQDKNSKSLTSAKRPGKRGVAKKAAQGCSGSGSKQPAPTG